ncbi:MAG: radical SAM protein [Pseudomonadota bacterium]
MTLKLNEIFYSIQGESTYAGYPCIFIRLAGCNLRCSYCDTTYAYDEGEDVAVEKIIDTISSYKCRLIEITGGEPLLQAETPALIRKLLDKNYRVLLETNGTLDTGSVDARCIKIMDIKCPSSGEEGKNNFLNLSKFTERDEIKFVIGTRDDYVYAKKILPLLQGNSLIQHIHFSPAKEMILPSTLSAWILEDSLDVRLNLQLHKIIWPLDQRGV